MSTLALEQQSQGPQSRLPSRPLRAPAAATPKIVIEPELTGVRLVSEEELDTTVLAREFPTVAVVVAREGVGGFSIDDFAWRGSFEFARFDDGALGHRPLGIITIRGDDSAGVACEVLARYQRFIARRNSTSSTHVFDDVLRRHAALYDTSLPLVQAELDHALDTWQWTLRLDPDASAGAQLAALFHDVERIERDAQEKLEHRAPEIRGTPKEGNARSSEKMLARGGAKDARARMHSVFTEAGVSDDDVAVATEILDGRERRAHEIAVLDEADALSFLSLESSRYADHFGLAQTRRKVAHTIGRLASNRARDRLRLIRLRPDIDRLLRA